MKKLAFVDNIIGFNLSPSISKGVLHLKVYGVDSNCRNVPIHLVFSLNQYHPYGLNLDEILPRLVSGTALSLYSNEDSGALYIKDLYLAPSPDASETSAETHAYYQFVWFVSEKEISQPHVQQIL